jgi:hypothetical protein
MIYSLKYIEYIISPQFIRDSQANSLMAEIERLGLRYEYEERAAILQYDSGLSREDAEAKALTEIIERSKQERNI